MVSEPVRLLLPFDDWKEALRADCEQKGKLLAYDALGEVMLQMWWEQGADPSIEAIVDASSERWKKF